MATAAAAEYAVMAAPPILNLLLAPRAERIKKDILGCYLGGIMNHTRKWLGFRFLFAVCFLFAPLAPEWASVAEGHSGVITHQPPAPPTAPHPSTFFANCGKALVPAGASTTTTPQMQPQDLSGLPAGQVALHFDHRLGRAVWINKRLDGSIDDRPIFEGSVITGAFLGFDAKLRFQLTSPNDYPKSPLFWKSFSSNQAEAASGMAPILYRLAQDGSQVVQAPTFTQAQEFGWNLNTLPEAFRPNASLTAVECTSPG